MQSFFLIHHVSFYNSWDLLSANRQTDRRDPEQEYIVVKSATPRYTCYIYLHNVSIPIFLIIFNGQRV